jgi:hypothetical protein
VAVEFTPDELKTSLIEGEMFVPYFRFIRDLDIFVDLALQGLHFGTQATEFPATMQRLARLSRLPDMAHFLDETVIASQAERAKPLEEFAKAEQSSGFPYLHGLACVRLMTIIETAVDEIVVAAFLKLPVPFDRPPLSRIEGPLLPFIRLSEQERAFQLTELLSRETRAPFLPGCAKFEILLEAVGLSGEIPALVRRLILEQAESRNVIVHKSGRVDARFLERCPWRQLKPGDVLPIDHKRFRLFLEATRCYLYEIYRRWTVMAHPLLSDPDKHTPPTTLKKLRQESEESIQAMLDAGTDPELSHAAI